LCLRKVQGTGSNTNIKVKGKVKVSGACIKSALGYTSEIWA